MYAGRIRDDYSRIVELIASVENRYSEGCDTNFPYWYSKFAKSFVQVDRCLSEGIANTEHRFGWALKPNEAMPWRERGDENQVAKKKSSKSLMEVSCLKIFISSFLLFSR